MSNHTLKVAVSIFTNDKQDASHELPFGTYGINFVDEDDTGRVFFCYAEELTNKLGTVAKVFLDEL